MDPLPRYCAAFAEFLANKNTKNKAKSKPSTIPMIAMVDMPSFVALGAVVAGSVAVVRPSGGLLTPSVIVLAGTAIIPFFLCEKKCPDFFSCRFF